MIVRLKSSQDKSRGSLELPYTSAGSEMIGKVSSTYIAMPVSTMPSIIPLSPMVLPSKNGR